MDCVVWPFDQTFPVADEEVKVVIPPSHIVTVPPGVIPGVGGADDTTTVTGALVEEQPLPLV